MGKKRKISQNKPSLTQEHEALVQEFEKDVKLSEKQLIKARYRYQVKAVCLKTCAEELPIQMEISFKLENALGNLIDQTELLKLEEQLAGKEVEKFEELCKLKRKMKTDLENVRSCKKTQEEQRQ